MADYVKRMYCVDKKTIDGITALKVELDLENNSQVIREIVKSAISKNRKGGKDG